MIYVAMLLGGLSMLAWNTWQRLGRSPGARSWVHDGKGDFAERNTLVLWPLTGSALVLGAALGPARQSTTATGVVGLCFLLVLLVCLTYMVLPLPVPRWAQPSWYRREPLSGAPRSDD